MLYGYLISKTSNANIGPIFYFTLSAESLYNRLQSLLRNLPTKRRLDIPNFWVLVKISLFLVCISDFHNCCKAVIEEGAIHK